MKAIKMNCSMNAQSIGENLMKKFFALIAFTSGMAIASKPQSAVYNGSGHWRNSVMESGTYEATTTVAEGSISSNYTFNGQTISWNIKMLPDPTGNFDILVDDKKVGSGYCLEAQCHYQIEEIDLEETLTFIDKRLYKVGSKSKAGVKVVWAESLSISNY